ncbi:MAG: hypothetical protein ACHQIG_09370, partial [Acidimicrobiia bacterium]
ALVVAEASARTLHARATVLAVDASGQSEEFDAETLRLVIRQVVDRADAGVEGAYTLQQLIRDTPGVLVLRRAERFAECPVKPLTIRALPERELDCRLGEPLIGLNHVSRHAANLLG